MSNRPERPANGEISLERTLGQRMHAFSNTISGYYYRRTEVVLGISLPEWRVLRSVLLSPGITQAEIAANEGLNVMNVSRAVAGLRRKGLVGAEPDTRDKRRTLLTATELGVDLGADIAPREEAVYQEVFAELTVEERESLDKLLGRVTDRLQSLELPSPVEPNRDWAAILRQQGDRKR